MREILFKAKLERDASKWVEGYFIKDVRHSLQRTYIVTKSDDFDTCSIFEQTLCQFTGFYDDNHRRIFENDIIRLKRDKEDNSTVDFIIYFSTAEGSWCARNFNDTNDIHRLYSLLLCSYERNVVGNVLDTEIKESEKDNYLYKALLNGCNKTVKEK